MDTIYKQYYSKLFAFINSRVQHKEDILSEVFIKIHNNIQKLDSDEKLTSWIYTITRNTIIDFYRKQNRVPVLQEFKEELIFDNIQDDTTVYDELSKCIEPIIDSLPDKYSKILALSEIKGIKQIDIATQNNLTLSNTKSIIFRGKKKIKDKLYECCSYKYDSLGNIIECNQKDENCNLC